ncbi:MAG TPA: TonB-dependent receptor [Hyphomonadaceae bacterium]|nr:TonB-dependent receptor [Hyphomonadaceae bacterium]
MGSASFCRRLRLSAAVGAIAAGIAWPAYAQDTSTQQQPPPSTVDRVKPADESTDPNARDVVVVTGTRLQSQFTSASPMTIISADSASEKGISDLASLLRDSTVAAGSPQITAITSTAFVQNGGTGVETISLRGLGDNRTLVLLDGRRAGPAGTRGSVGAFDLNVIPLSAIERVDILKDGASSIYGSDAVAGVVNIITKKGDDSSVNAFYSRPTEEGGAQLRVNGSYGATFGNMHFRVTGDYYKQEELRRGQRDFFDCAQPYVFNTDGSRADVVDPRTGKPNCTSDLPWGHVWYYDYGADPSLPWRSNPGLIQYDYDHNLGQFIPPFGPVANNFHAPPNWFPVSYGSLFTNNVNDPYYGPSAKNSVAVENFHHPFQDNQSLSPEVERMTVFANGEWDLNDHATIYAEALLNRRTTKVSSYRQFWTFQYVYDYGYINNGVSDGDYVGDPLAIAQGWTGDNTFFSPTTITDHAGDTTQVDYMRFVGGARGDLNFLGMDGWTWDTSVQFSRSRGSYKTDIIWDDAITPYQYRSDTCAGTVTDYRGVPCMDINWYDPQFLAGNFSAAERAFLFGTIKGHTTYEETSFEGFASGKLFDLPAGPLGVVIGVDYQHDRINDVPAQATQDGATWGDSKAGITRGSDNTKAVFTEVSIPIVKGLPFIEDLSLSASGRYTDVDSYGSQSTYKVGLNWQTTPWMRFRASQGTSFRSPALFELYLFNETSFGSLRVDPCNNWGSALANGTITQRIADNCAADGIPNNKGTAGVSPTITSSGGAGNLNAETSTAKSLGVIFTPSFANLKVSIDYFDIEVDNEVTKLGATNILLGCYQSDHHATDPLCSLFTRIPAGSGGAFNLATITDNYINIATQHNRGVDFEALYKLDLPVGQLSMRAEASRGLEVQTQLLPSSVPRDTNGEIGNPEWVGNFELTYDLDDWSFFYGLRYVGETSNVDHFGSQPQTYFGQPVRYVLSTDAFTYSSISVSHDLPWGMSARVGVSNVFDQEPPFVTTISGEYNTVGNVPLDGSQYDFFGRTVFVDFTKKF